MDKTTQEDYKFSSVLDLHKITDAGVLVASHDSVVEFHVPNMETRELCHNFLAGDPWTAEEREVGRQKKKPLTEFNPLKTSERTFVGNIIQQRYDIKPAPREPNDQSKADVYTHMYHWTADLTETRYKDPNLVRSAWAGGNAWQESFVEVTPGKKPRIIVNNENNFAIYPDPNRRDLVNNSDCEFIDRESWMSRSQLCDAIPDKEDEILAGLPDPTSTEYERIKVHADRAHEYQNYRNGKYRVIERFYKVRKKNWFGVSPQGERMDIGQDVSQEVRQSFKEDYPDYNLAMEREEYLHLAIVCPSLGNVFLYNGPYHCQPRDTTTGKIMFPLVELVDEELDGQPVGHVFSQISGIKLINSLLTNALYQAKNAAGQSHVGSADHFDETTRADIEENHNDGARTFWKKPGAPEGSGLTLIEQGQAAPDNSPLLEYASNYVVEVSSTPPSMKGQSEGNVAGVLNEQRIQQSFIQNQPFTNNYLAFLTRRAKLWKYYWKEYWKGEDVIRILEKKDDKDPDWIKINEIVTDTWGNVSRRNTFDDADAYDMTFEDSWKSPTVRDKVRKQLSELMGNKASQEDPELNAMMFAYFLQLSDAPQEFKSQVKTIAENKQKAAEERAKNGTPPEPLRLSMSIKSEDLHDANTIALLGHAKVIPPELAQAMSQSGPVAAPADPSIAIDAQREAQKMDLEAKHKAGELGIKAQETQVKTVETARTLDLKERELALKEKDLALKAAEAQSKAQEAKNQPQQDPQADKALQIELATIKAQTEIEKATIAAQASLQSSEMTIASSDEKRTTEKAAKQVNEKTAASDKAIQEVRKAHDDLAGKVEKQGETIEDILKAVKAPKKITVERDGEGKIVGATATIEGGR